MSKPNLSELKQMYKKSLVKAQRKFRKEKMKGSNSIPFQEAVRSGGQFTFRGVKTPSDLYAEVTRINSYLNTRMEQPELFIKRAHERAANYLPLFEPGMTKEERANRDLADNMANVYKVYRMLQEENPGAITRGGIFESSSFFAYLYSMHVEGMDEEQIQKRGHDLIEEILALRQERFRSDIPTSRFNRGGLE